MMNMRFGKIIGCLQEPDKGQVVDTILRIKGWVLSVQPGRPEFDVYIDGKLMDTAAQWLDRPDVFEVHKTWSRDNNPTPGFFIDIPAITFDPGRYRVKVVVRHGSLSKKLGSRTFRIEGQKVPRNLSAPSVPAINDQVVFFHVPKTAGTSLNAYLRAQFKPSESAIHIEDKALGRPWTHDDFKDKKLITGHLDYNAFAELFDLYKVFLLSVFREPRRQALSVLARLRRHTEADHAAVKQNLGPGFREMIDRYEKVGPVEFLNSLRGLEWSVVHNAHTRALLSIPPAGKLDESQLPLAFQNMARFNLIGITEHLDKCLSLMSYYMGWKPARSQPQLNTATRSHYRQLEETDELMAAIDSVTQCDRQIYDCAAALFDRQFANMLRALAAEFPGDADALFDPETQPAVLQQLLQQRAGRS